LELVIANECGGAFGDRCREFGRCRTASIALVLHQRRDSRHVDRHASLVGQLGREFNRKPERVM